MFWHRYLLFQADSTSTILGCHTHASFKFVKYNFEVTLLQAAILILFNEKTELTMKEIKEILQIPD